MLAEALYRTEDYAGLSRLAAALPECDPLLPSIGAKLASVGLAGGATAAYLRAGDAARAVDACVALHEWDAAMALAAEHGYPQVGERPRPALAEPAPGRLALTLADSPACGQLLFRHECV